MYGKSQVQEEVATYEENSGEIGVNNEHDKTFRNILNNKQEAANFINKTLKLKKKITADQLEKYTCRFITNDFKDRESDVIYKIKGKKVFILIEHQTKIDYKIPYRIVEYKYEIIRSEVDVQKLGQKGYKLPVVKAIVLYTGKQKWNVKKYLEEVQEKLEGTERQKLGEYEVVDVNNFSAEELLEEKSLLSKAMLLEKARDNEEIVKYLDEIIKEINSNDEVYTNEIKEIFATMIDKILKKKIGEEKAKELIQNIKRERGEGNMMTVFETIEEDNKRIFNNGRQEGRKMRNIEIIKNMLKEKFSIESISKVTGMTKSEIQKIKSE